MLSFRTRWRRWDTCYGMDTWQNRHTRENSTGTGSQNPSCSAALKAWLPVRPCASRHCQLIHGSQPLDHCWQNQNTKGKKRLTTRIHQGYYASREAAPTPTYTLSPYVRYPHHCIWHPQDFLTERYHPHLHTENVTGFIHVSVQSLGYISYIE